MTNSSVETFECVGFDSRPQIMIEFRLANGNAIALSYACLICAEFDASGAIILTFTEYSVSIRGQNLTDLFHKIQLHHTPWVAVVPRGQILTEPGRPRIQDMKCTAR